MHENTMGQSGWRIHSLGLGTLGWGRDIDADTAHQLLQGFQASAGDLLEVAPHYGDGKAVKLISELLPDLAFTPQLVGRIGVHFAAGELVIDCSRQMLWRATEELLDQLQRPRLDCLIVAHYDMHTPLQELAQTLIDIVRAGLTTYIGVANFPAWAFTHLYDLVSRSCPGVFVAYEGEYSLLERGIEREVLPATYNLGCGFIASSPLACGVLTGKYHGSTPPDSRAAAAHLQDLPGRYLQPAYQPIIEAVETAADGLGWSPLEVALAWVTRARGVSLTLIGPRTPSQLDAYLAAANLQLPTRIREVLDEVAAPVFAYPDPAVAPLLA